MQSKLERIQSITIEEWFSYLLSIFIFSLPFSASGRSIVEILIIASIVFIPHLRAELIRQFRAPVGRACLILVGVTFLGCFYSHAFWSEKLLIFEKYSKILCLPFFILAFQITNTAQRAIKTFIVAMTLTSLLLFIKHIGWINYTPTDTGRLFHNHIITSYLMDMAIYLSLWMKDRVDGTQKRPYYLAFFSMSLCILFVNNGRMGNILYFVILGTYMIQHWQQLKCRNWIVGGGLFLMAVSFQISPVFKKQVDDMYQQIKTYDIHKNTSIGLRFQFYDYAKSLIQNHPILGSGTGGFTAAFRTDKPVTAWNKRLLEPHNFYLLIACEFGLLGLCALGYYFYILARESLKAHQFETIGMTTLIVFLIGNVTDSLFFYSVPAYCFMIFMALSIGNGNRQKI